MAEETIIIDDDKRAAHNADVIQKQAAQDISATPAGGMVNVGDTISALDSLRDQIVEKKKVAADELGGGDKIAADKIAADKIAADKAAADKAAADKIDSVSAEEAAAASAKKIENETAQQAASKKIADDLFKDIPVLPANASPKSSEAFSAIKSRAAQEISRLNTELERTTAEVKTLREESKEAVTPELKQELESLREFRLRLDIETDPKFKEFDKNIFTAHDFIYAQLKKSPAITDEVIADIKKLGGPENVKMDKIFDAIKDPLIQRLVEAKLADVELAKYNKDQAIAANKADVKKYLTDRQQQWEASASAHNTQTQAELDNLIGKIGWLNPTTPDAKAGGADKKTVDDHNAYAESTRKEIELAMADDSPQMRATLLVGMAQLFRLQTAHELLIKNQDVVKKELTEAQTTITRLKSASASRLRESGAPVSEGAPPKKENTIFTERAADALDRIRAEKAAQQAKT